MGASGRPRAYKIERKLKLRKEHMKLLKKYEMEVWLAVLVVILVVAATN